MAEDIERQDQAPHVHGGEQRGMANDVPDTDLKFEDFEPTEVRRETPEMTEPYGPREALSTPPTPARGGDAGIEVLTPRGDSPEMELDVFGRQ